MSYVDFDWMALENPMMASHAIMSRRPLGNAQRTVNLDGEADILVVRIPALQNWVHCSLLQSGCTAPVLAHYVSSSIHSRNQSCSWFKIIWLDPLLVNWPGSTYSWPNSISWRSEYLIAKDIIRDIELPFIYFNFYTTYIFQLIRWRMPLNFFFRRKNGNSRHVCKSGFIAVWGTKKKLKH